LPGYPGYPTAYQQEQPAGTPGTTRLALFGQSFSVPVVLPPLVVRYQQTLAYAVIGLLALMIALFAVLPAVASGQIASAEQALQATLGHQAKVDAGFAGFLAADTGVTDLNVIKAEGSKQVKAADDALALLRSDESAIASADQRLAILGFFALPARGSINVERNRLATVSNGLKQADTAMTAASNQGKVLLPLYDAMIDFTRMYAALGKRDLAGAGAPYPDAEQKLQQAISADQAEGVPSGLAKQLSAFSDLLDNSENMIQALQNKDAAGIKKYSDAVQAGLKTVQTLSDAVPSDYEVKTYGPYQKAYDSAIKSLRRPA
jgi:hypothetical protein